MKLIIVVFSLLVTLAHLSAALPPLLAKRARQPFNIAVHWRCRHGVC